MEYDEMLMLALEQITTSKYNGIIVQLIVPSSVELTQFLNDLGNTNSFLDEIIPPPSDFSDTTATTDSLLDPQDLKPVEFLMDDAPFNKFSIDMLLQELDFSHKFDNRSVVYFG